MAQGKGAFLFDLENPYPYQHARLFLIASYWLETERCYKRLLIGHSDVRILFNPEIDTLAVSYEATRQTSFRQTSGGLLTEHKYWLTLDQSMLRLKSLLRRDRENLASTQTIALGNARWPITPMRQTGIGATREDKFLDRFETSLQNSFRNLSKIILVQPPTYVVNPEPGVPPSFYNGLQDPEGRDVCRRQIREMFEARREINPVVKIPEVIILDADDPQAPYLGP